MAIKYKRHDNSAQAGVTLIEMIVVVGIIAVVSSIMMFNYSDFSTNVSIRNLSQEVALSVRKAQTYATSVRPIEALSNLSSRTFAGYGISFAIGSNNGASNIPDEKHFVLFADTNMSGSVASPDNLYQPGLNGTCGNPAVGDECLELVTITSSDRVVCITSDPQATADTCTPATQFVDITFLRPSPDAHICFKDSVSGTCQNQSFARVVLESAKGLKRSIVVWNTGQISVQ